MERNGFSLIELLIIVALSVIVTTVGFLSFQSFRDRKDLELTMQEVGSAVKEVQRRSATQEDGKRWSMRFTATTTGVDKYEIYSGTTYSTSVIDVVRPLRKSMKFGEPSENRTVDLQFAPITGKISNNKIISINSGRGSRVADIIVNTLGLVTERLEDDIVGYWHFDEGMGTSTYDASGSGNTGTATGTTWLAPSGCKAGQCLSFDGVDDHVEVPDDASLKPTSAITVTVWVNPDNTIPPDSFANFVRKADEAPSTDGYFLQYDGSNPYPRFCVHLSSSATCSSATSVTLTAGQWWYIVGVYDGSNVLIYVNGDQKNSVSASGSIVQDADILSIGSRGALSDYFDGSIDEVRIYSRALTAAEIKDRYNDFK